MPGSSFSISAFKCINGSKLAKIQNTVCSKCYARKGSYRFNNVKRAQEARYDLMVNRRVAWKTQMIAEISKTKSKYFRWFDAGDVQSYENILDIIEICVKTPKKKHWIPTKEYNLWQAYILEHGDLPDNVILRVSSPKVDQAPLSWKHTCTVVKDKEPWGHLCPAPTQSNKCGDCRACWDKRIKNVTYKEH